MNNMPNIKISDELKLVTDENLINKFLEEMPYKKYVDIIFTKLLAVYSYKDYYIAVMAHTDSYALRYAYEMVVFTADGSGHCVGHPKDDSDLEFDLTPHIIDDQFIRTIKRNQKSESFIPSMSIKQLTEELDKFLESESVFNVFKEIYPEPLEEDLTDKYLNLLIEKVSPAIGKEEQIETYKNKVKIIKIVSYPMDTVGYVRVHINGEYYNESVLRGSISLQTRSDSDKDYASMDVFAGFLHNPIGQIRHSWTINNPLIILNNEDAVIKGLIDEMASAMKQSRAADKAYCDYVARTGDLS